MAKSNYDASKWAAMAKDMTRNSRGANTGGALQPNSAAYNGAGDATAQKAAQAARDAERVICNDINAGTGPSNAGR